MNTLHLQFLILIIAGWANRGQGLNNELIEKATDELHMTGAVECREGLGGVLKYYYRRAA